MKKINRKAAVAVTAALILAAATPLLAQEKAPKKQAGKIQIHTFALKGKTDKIAYYANVLPRTLYRYLEETGTYSTELKGGPAPAIDTANPGAAKNKPVLKALAQNDKNIHYICTGIIEPDPAGGTRATIIIYNIKTDKLRILDASRLESGAVLGTSMDTLSDSVMKRFDFAVAEARKPVKSGASPYLGLARAMSYLDFGITTGYVFFVGDFRNYNSCLEVRTHIGFDFSFLTPNLALRFTGAYFSTDAPGTVSLSAWNVGGSAWYEVPFNKYVSFNSEIGSGVSMERVVSYDTTPGPFAAQLENLHNNRAYMYLGIGVGLHFSAVSLNFTTGYRRIFQGGSRGIDMISLNASIVYGL